jgi:hypothetical protein
MPRKLRRALPECVVRTVQEEGWAGLENGALLGRAEEKFDVFVTADRRLEFQQNLSDYAIGIVVIITPRLWYRVLITIASALREAIAEVQRGQILRIRV